MKEEVLKNHNRAVQRSVFVDSFASFICLSVTFFWLELTQNMSKKPKEEYYRFFAVSEPRTHEKGHTEYKVTARVSVNHAHLAVKVLFFKDMSFGYFFFSFLSKVIRLHTLFLYASVWNQKSVDTVKSKFDFFSVSFFL